MSEKILVSSQERDAAVLAVLISADAPLGPTEIGVRVNASWSTYGGPHGGKSAAIVPVLRRIGAIRTGAGKYTKPA